MIITRHAQAKLVEAVEAVDPNHISILVSNDPDFEKIPRGLRGSVNVYVHRGVVRYVSPSYSARFPIGSKWDLGMVNILWKCSIPLRVGLLHCGWSLSLTTNPMSKSLSPLRSTPHVP